MFVRDIIAANTDVRIVDFTEINDTSAEKIRQISLNHKHVFFRHYFNLPGCEKILPLIDDNSYGIVSCRNKVDALVSFYKYWQAGKPYGFKRQVRGGHIICVPYKKAFKSMMEGQYAKVAKERLDYDITQARLNNLFPSERRMHFNFEDMVTDQKGFIIDLLTWLDLMPPEGHEAIIVPVNENASYWPKNMFLHKSLGWLFHKLTGLDSNLLQHSYTPGKQGNSLAKMIYTLNKKREFLTPTQREELTEKLNAH